MVRSTRLSPRDFGVYVVTDRHQTQGRPLAACVEAAVRGGAGAVQLREKDLGGRELMRIARVLRKITSRYGAALLINDRIDVALACGADGVHLPADSFSVQDARALLGSERLVGVSAHAPGEVIEAEHAGADFAVLGPIFDTPSKRPYGPPLGLDALRQATVAVAMPVFAIGGVTAERLPEVLAAGAAGAAVIRAILAAPDPEPAARAFRANRRQ